MNHPIDHVTRFTRPTKLDRAPYKTLWTYQGEDDEQEQYLQVHENENDPAWIRLGTILEYVYSQAIQIPEVKEELCELFKELIT